MLVHGPPGPDEGDILQVRGYAPIATVTVSSLVRRVAPLSDARAFLHILRILANFRPVIVHTHMAKAGLLGRLAARLLGVPIVVHTFHGNVLEGYFGVAASAALVHAERMLARLSTRVVAISARQADELLRLRIGNAEKVVTIPLGLDLAAFREAQGGRLRGELGLGGDTELVGIVSRLVPIKAIDVFLRSAALIARRRAIVHFVVVGDGALATELRRQAQDLGLENRVHFLGWRGDLPAIYADLDVVMLTSRNEGTPVSVIEAMAAARPVVAASVGGVPDVITGSDVGVLVPRDEPQAAAQAVLDLLEEPERQRRLGRAAAQRVLREYGADQLVRRIDSLYDRLVHEDPRRS